MTKNIYGVIGANYGDEGKGRTVDAICRNHIGSKIVVCTNGSSQRGHTVISESIRHVFHHFGSGTIAGADTYFCKDFILNPIMFEQEENELKEKNIIRTLCFANENCRVATVYDMMVNQILELTRTDKHGSCGCGVWETIQRYKYGPNLSIKELAELSENELLMYLESCRDFCKKRILTTLSKEQLSVDIYNEYIPLFESASLLSAMLLSIDHFLNSVRLSSDSSFLNEYDTVIFENGQGLLLDYRVDAKLSTPSITGAEAIQNVIEDNFIISDDANINLYYVTRTYITRHGSSDFKEKCDVSEINPDIIDETNQPNPYQGVLEFGKLCFLELYERIKQDVSKINRTVNFGLSVTHIQDYPWLDEVMPIGNLWLEFS